MKFKITSIKENPHDGVEIEYVSPLHKEKLKKIFWKLPETKKRNYFVNEIQDHQY